MINNDSWLAATKWRVTAGELPKKKKPMYNGFWVAWSNESGHLVLVFLGNLYLEGGHFRLHPFILKVVQVLQGIRQ